MLVQGKHGSYWSEANPDWCTCQGYIAHKHCYHTKLEAVQMDSKMVAVEDIDKIIKDYTSSLDALNRMFGGTAYNNNEIFGLHGKANIGKTLFLLQEAFFRASEGDNVLYIDSVLPEQPVLVKKKGVIKLREIGAVVNEYFIDESEGNKEIENLECLAMSKDGEMRWKKVNRVYRHFNDEMKFRFILSNGQSVETTSAHSLVVGVRNGNKKYIDTFVPKLASDVKVGDRIPLPCNVENDGGDLEVLDVAEYIDEYKSLNGGEADNRKILGKIRLTDDFIKFLGWYLAEGYTVFKKGEGIVRLYLNYKTDDEGIESVKNVARELKLKFLEYKRESDSMYGVSSVSLALLFKILFKGSGAMGKRVPDIVFNMSKRQQEIFLKAWTDGDYGSSVSKNLISDMGYLGMMIGKRFSIYRMKRVGKRFVFGKRNVVAKNDIYCISGSKPFMGMMKFFRKDDIMLGKVKRIEAFDRKCMVYDLSVDGDNTFVSGYGGIVVHNTEGGTAKMIQAWKPVFEARFKKGKGKIFYIDLASFSEVMEYLGFKAAVIFKRAADRGRKPKQVEQENKQEESAGEIEEEEVVEVEKIEKGVKPKKVSAGAMQFIVSETLPQSQFELDLKESKANFVIFDSTSAPIRTVIPIAQQNNPAKASAMALILGKLREWQRRKDFGCIVTAHTSWNPAETAMSTAADSYGGNVLHHACKRVVYMDKREASALRFYRRLWLMRMENEPDLSHLTAVRYGDTGVEESDKTFAELITDKERMTVEQTVS